MSGYGNQNGRNTFVGYKSGYTNASAIDGTFIGYQSGLLSTTGSNGTFIGSGTGDANTTGANNTALGKDALGANTTSADSTCLGYQAGLIATGANNVYIGSGCDGSAAARTGVIGIGKGVSVTANNTWVIGTIGIKHAIVEGTNAAMGLSAAMTTGSIVISNTLVTANSRIFLTINVPGGTPGAVYVSARNAGTDFTISSTSVLDTSQVAWEIKEPN
jgi:hypothetical protein